MITNPFEILVTQNLETFSFFIFLALKFIPSLETQVHLFYAHADIKARFTSFKSAFKNKNIHEQKQGDRP